MEQAQLKNLIKKRHPEYEETLPHWEFLSACYKGGRGWFRDNIFRYIKEGDLEYGDRVDRAYRFNHTREVVDLVDKYLFKGEIKRNLKDVTPEIEDFWRSATKGGLDINQFVKQLSRKSSIYGSEWVVVDSSVVLESDSVERPENVSVKDVQMAGGRIFAYAVDPQHVLDFSYDDDGFLIWVLIREQVRDDDDPFDSSGDVKDRYRLWTKNSWFLIEEESEKGTRKKTLSITDSNDHNLGVVPVFRVDFTITDQLWQSPALIADVAYLDKAVANYLSNLDAIIQDQTFSQLAMPAQGLMPGEDGYDKMLEMGTKRIFLYDGERGGEPKYIAPDPKQANVILGVISKIINEIYHSVGVAGERTKEDNSQGIDNSSGVAKAFDFERVNSLLVSKAASLEKAERQLVHLVNLWAGNKNFDDRVVEYSKSFDVRGLSDEFQIATQLALIEAPDAMRREQMSTVVSKLFPMLEGEIENKIRAELKQWPPKVEQILPSASLPSSKPKLVDKSVAAGKGQSATKK